MTGARRPPKVMHVIAGLGTGGAETRLASLVAAARPNPPRQVVVDLLAGGANAGRIRAAGVPLVELGISRSRPDVDGVRRLARLIRDERPDVIQGWMYHADLLATLALLRAGRRAATRLYWGVRCSNMETRRYGVWLRLVIAACARLSRLPTGVVFNSEAGRAVHEALGYRPRRALVIDNGIDTARFRPDPEARRRVRARLRIAPEAPVLIMPARLDPMKDHETFLAMLDRLPGVVGVVTGDKTQFLPERPNLLALGTVADMAPLYAAADLVVSTSAFGEGFSNAIAEGMAAGLPAVATDVGDAGRIVGDAGLIVPPRRADALANAVQTLLDEPGPARADRRRRARARIRESFSLERFVAAFDALHLDGAPDGHG